MSKSFVATLCCLLSIAFLSVAHADSQLDLSMKRMGKAYKQLALDLKQPVDASKADYLTLAGTMKTEAQTSRGLVPKKAAALPADQQAAMVADYQKSMDDLMVTIDDLTKSIQGSQWDAARTAMDSLKKQMSVGHKEFRSKGGAPANTTSAAPATNPAAPSQ